MGDLGPLSGSGTQGLTSPIPSRSQQQLGTSCSTSANVLRPCSVSFLTEHVVCVCMCVCVCPRPKQIKFPRSTFFFFFFKTEVCVSTGFPGGSMVKNLPANAGDTGSIHGSGRSPGDGNGYPLQYSCLGNPMDRGTRWATVHGSHKIVKTT